MCAPIGLIFYVSSDDATKTLAIEASEIVRLGVYDNGNVDIRTKQGESLETVTPFQDLVDAYAALVSGSE